jgi:2-polyprenyl-3-methyl-5-hydroxy-6-metoxy-1,4-benzoquinol methylase
MALIVDPEQNEIRALERVADWRGKRVIEIGCGNGRLTLRLAGLGARVHAIDPDEESIRAGREGLPRRFARHVSYHAGQAEGLAFRTTSFDLAVFAWSL